MSVEGAVEAEVNIAIEYCVGCKWMLRAAWLAQELLSTFQDSIHEVSLRPIKEPAGTFKIFVNHQQVWDRKINNGFPDSKELKQLVRDIAFPDKSLGHIDRSK